MAIDPVTAIADAISQLSKTIALALSGDNRKLLEEVHNLKKLKKAVNIAEEIFAITDKVISDNDEYQKLRRKFDKND